MAPRLDQQLCFAVHATAHAFARRYKPLLEPLGLTYPQYLVMLVLWEGDDLTVKALGERLALDSATLTPLLKRLEQAGLVTRSRDALDERKVRVALTANGAGLREAAAEVHAAIGCATGLDATSAHALRDQLHELRQSLG